MANRKAVVALQTPAATTDRTSLNIPHGAAPSSPVDGDVWTTSAGMYVRINGTTLLLPPTSSPTFSGTVTAGTNLSITGASATDRNVIFKTAGTNRWSFGVNSSNETGSNAGSDFTLARYDDAGSWLATALSVSRDTGVVNLGARLNTAASATGMAGLRLPHGTAPSTPGDGDVWTTTAGLFVRINGSTVGPLGTGGGGTPATTVTTLAGLQAAVVGTATNYAREDHKHAVSGLVDTTTDQSVGGQKTFTARTHFTAPLHLYVTSADPGSPETGEIYYNDTSLGYKFYNGSAWRSVADLESTQTFSGAKTFSGEVVTGGASVVQAGVAGLWSLRNLIPADGGYIGFGAHYYSAGWKASEANQGAVILRRNTGHLDVMTAPANGAVGNALTTVTTMSIKTDNSVTFGGRLVHGTSDATNFAAVLANTLASGSPKGLLALTGQNQGTGAVFEAGVGTEGSYTSRFKVDAAGLITVGTGGRVVTAATSATAAGLNIPHGTAPSSPVNGDIWTTTAGIFVRINGNTYGPLGEEMVPFYVSGTLTTGTGKARIYMERAGIITGVRTAVGTAPTGASVICDVNKNGTTIFTTQGNRPTIAASGFTSGRVTNMDVTAVAAGDYLTVDVDQIGSTIAGADLTIVVTVVQ